MTLLQRLALLVFFALTGFAVPITATAVSQQGESASMESSDLLGRGDPVRGEKLYQARCAGCHSLDANRIGPRHRGVYGRVAGSLDDFDYSKALRTSELSWNDETLDSWLTNPEGLIPGQRMGFRLSDETARADVIAYLRQESIGQ